MVKRNPNMAKLGTGYLFPEIERRKTELLKRVPDAKIISLGVGNTTEPLTPFIDEALTKAASGLGTPEGYFGYGEEQGMTALRNKIAEVIYDGMFEGDEVFVSDGAKCDIGRLQIMFGSDKKIAVQDPAYPVYVDSSVIMGQTGQKNGDNFEGITYMKCNMKNNFFPNLKEAKDSDIIYFCSPSNPTGAVATRENLEDLVRFAKENKIIIVFDSAYRDYIYDENLPKSIFEIDGAKEVAIEVGSFSKSAGFTGVRLGWTIVPNELKYEDGEPVGKDYGRISTTLFNGASNIAQMGGLAALSNEGLKETKSLVDYYMKNARMIKSTLNKLGIKSVGGDNSPYIWAHFPGKKSWDIFSEMLENLHIVAIPGSGFGPTGEGFMRMSAFGHHNNIKEACKRLKKLKFLL